MKKENILKILIFITGFVCLYSFIAIRVLPLFNTVLKEKMIPGYWDKTTYGELYYFSCISHFREKGLPRVNEKFQYSENQSNLEETDIFIFGDSFFDIARGTQFPKRIMEETGKNVHYVYKEPPLEYFARNHYTNKEPKLLIFGRVERYIPYEFNAPHEPSYVIDDRTEFRKTMANVKDKIFYTRSEELYDALMKKSIFTSDIYSFVSTIKFDLFQYISNLTPVYAVNDTIPWLFYHDQVNGENTSFYYHHSSEEIENYCTNLEDLSNKLLKMYNIKLLFLPIPAKYTLYHTFINNDPYNNFLPLFYAELETKDVNYIRLLNDYLNANEILYYGTDSHWKKNGMDMAVEKIMEFMENDSTMYHYIN